MSENKYLYSVTRIRALETKLLDKTKIERMIDAKNAEEIIKILAETDYSNSISEMADISDYDKILSKEIVKTYDLISEISPAPELTNIFRIKYDVHNIKVLLKSYYLGEDNDGLLVSVGTIPVVKVKAYLKDKDFSELNPILRDGIEQVINQFSISSDPQMIDLVLDKCLYDIMYETAHKNKNKFLTNFISNQIDLVNIKTFIRLKALGLGREYLSKTMIDHGNLSFVFFNELLDEPVDVLIEKLSISDYSRVIDEGIANFIKTKRLTKFEKLADDYIFDIAKKGKYVAFGIEPLIGYIMAKENEVKIIRMIMVGKMNEIPNDVIRERLRDVYV